MVLDAGSSRQSDTGTLDDEALRVLKTVATEMGRDTGPDEVFPAVVNLVHPSFYPPVYGRTPILPKGRKIARRDVWAGVRDGTRSLPEPHQLVEMMTAYARHFTLGLDGWDCSDVLDF